MIELTCRHCGKRFAVYPSEAEGRKYCSRECRYASPEEKKKRSQATRKAWEDPETRQRIAAGIAARSGNSEWLSAAHFRKGAAHPQYRGNKAGRQAEQGRYAYKTWRSAVIKRDNYTCQECGKQGGGLDVHHIKPWAEYPELRYEVDNGRTLCFDCHDHMHGRTRQPKYTHCVDCGEKKRSTKTPRCKSCGAKNAHQEAGRGLPKTCPSCGKNFIGEAKNIYCSKSCYHSSLKSGRYVSCTGCGQSIWRTEKDIKRSKSGQFFCSNQCRSEYRLR